MMIGPRGRLNVLQNVVRNPKCTLCELSRTEGNICVMGRGNVRNDVWVVLVGEAPGQAEAETGQPFMGQSGKLLNRLIEIAGVKPYITNICKCRPPNNRTPQPEEAAICTKTYLSREIELLTPTSVVLLGTTAARWAFAGSGFVRNKEYYMSLPGVDMKHKLLVFPTWHPAYCLRKGGIGKKPTNELLDVLKRANVPF